MAYQLATAKIWNGTAWIDAVGGLQPVTSGGDYEDEANGYYYNVFTQNGTLTVSREVNCEILMVGGGGGGGGAGGSSGGGGGAGGLILTTATLTAGSYSVGIGTGASAGASGGTATPGGTGGDTTFNGLTAKGGGGGGGEDVTRSGTTGASSGGAGDNGNTQNPVAPLGLLSAPGDDVYGRGEQGHYGASSNGGSNTSGGGGGAGSPGKIGGGQRWRFDDADNLDFGQQGSGGEGVRLDSWGADCSALGVPNTFESVTWTGISGSVTAYFIASGGSGGYDNNSGRIRAPYGGGAWGAYQDGDALTALDNSGGGGGGGSSNNLASDGADGVCIVRYRV